MQVLTLIPLTITAGLILLSAFALSRHKFLQLLRRTRWIMFSLLLIYAYSTPGQGLFGSLGVLSPTLEGLGDGALQLGRLLAALAALAILLDRLHRQALIAGLYTLFAPLQWLGLSRERVAVRLALTLHYAEVVMLRGTHWRETLRSLFEPHGETAGEIELPLYRFTLGDAGLLACGLIMMWLALR